MKDIIILINNKRNSWVRIHKNFFDFLLNSVNIEDALENEDYFESILYLIDYDFIKIPELLATNENKSDFLLNIELDNQTYDQVNIKIFFKQISEILSKKIEEGKDVKVKIDILEDIFQANFLKDLINNLYLYSSNISIIISPDFYLKLNDYILSMFNYIIFKIDSSIYMKNNFPLKEIERIKAKGCNVGVSQQYINDKEAFNNLLYLCNNLNVDYHFTPEYSISNKKNEFSVSYFFSILNQIDDSLVNYLYKHSNLLTWPITHASHKCLASIDSLHIDNKGKVKVCASKSSPYLIESEIINKKKYNKKCKKCLVKIFCFRGCEFASNNYINCELIKPLISFKLFYWNDNISIKENIKLYYELEEELKNV